MKCRVVIEEHISVAFDVEATSAEEAVEIGKRMYHTEEIAVDPYSAPTCKMIWADDGQYQTPWEEF